YVDNKFNSRRFFTLDGVRYPTDYAPGSLNPNAETYVWRSASIEKNLRGASTIDVRSYAVVYNGWPSDTTTLDATASDAGTIRGIGSGSSNSVNPSLDTVPEGYNPEFPNNGVRYYTVAFAGTYGAQPPEPVKTVSDHRARALGEAVTFSISQEVNTYGEDLFTPYQSFVIHDTIDANLDYVSAKLVYTAPESSKKTDVTAAAGALSYDQSKRMVGYAFSKDYLQASRVGENTDPTSAMVYRGGTYTLEIQAKVKSDAKAQLSNTGFSTINGMEKSTEEVSVVVGAASVDLAKSVKFEHAVGDEATYTIALENPRAGTVARNVHISDKLPDGLVPVEGSLVSSGVPTDAIVQAVKDNKVVAETVSNSSARAQLEGASLSATIPFLPADKVVTYSLKVKCSEANNGKEFFNTATATIENPSSGSEGSVSATDGLWVNNAVLKVDKQADAFEYGVGDTVSYTVVLRNTAEGTIARDVKIEDATLPPYLKLDPKSVKVTGLPDPVSYPVDGSGVHKAENRTNKHTLATSGNGFVVSIPYLPAGAPVTVTYTATALEAGNGKETVNTVKATCANPLDPKTKTEASDGIWVNAVKLDVLKRADAFEYRTGDTVTYLLTLTNNGPAGTIARDVVLTDDLPDRVAFDQGSVHVEGVAAKVAYPVDGKGQHREEERAGSYVLTEAGNGFTLRIPYLPSGQTATVTYTATATRDSNGLETFNSATAQPANPLPGSESATSKDGVWTNEAVLALSKEVETYEYQVGSEVRYAVRYRNIAPGTVARDVVMEDVSLPSGMRLQPESIAVEGVPETVAYLADGDGLHSEEQRDNPYKVEVDGNAFAVSHPYLPAGADVTVSYTAVPTEEVNGDEIVNTAKVEASNMLDGIGAEDSAVVWVNTPRLLVTKHALETRVAYKQGDVVTYRIQVDNEAAGTFARNVGIDDLFQVEGMQLLRSSVVVFDAEGSLVDPGAYQVAQRMSDANWSVPTTLNLVSTAGNHGVWEEGARHESEQLNPLGESKQERVFVEFQASVTAAELDGREVTNVAGAWADNAEKAFDEEAILVDLPKPEPEPQPDPQPEPQPLGHLSVVKFSDPKSGQPVKAGDTIEYTLLASNQGDAPVEGVAVYDEVPVGTTFASMDENDHGSVDDQGRAVRWLIETIEPGKTIALRFKVTVDPDLDDFYQIRNQATYAQDRTELPDGPLPTPTNDVVNPVQVDDGPAVVVRKASDPEHNTKVVPGQEITYSLTAINTGARTAAYTVVRDYLPAGTTFVEGSIEGEGVFVPATAIGDQDIDPATESEAPVAASAQEGEGGQSVDNAGVYGGEESDGPGSDVDERGADAHGSQASESREGRSAQEASEEFGNQKADGEPGSEESNDQEAKGRQQSDRAYVEFLVRDLEVGDSAAQTVSFRVKVGDNPVALVENSALFNVVESEPTLGDPDTSEPEQQTNTVIHPVEPRPASPVDQIRRPKTILQTIPTKSLRPSLRRRRTPTLRPIQKRRRAPHPIRQLLRSLETGRTPHRCRRLRQAPNPVRPQPRSPTPAPVPAHSRSLSPSLRPVRIPVPIPTHNRSPSRSLHPVRLRSPNQAQVWSLGQSNPPHSLLLPSLRQSRARLVPARLRAKGARQVLALVLVLVLQLRVPRRPAAAEPVPATTLRKPPTPPTCTRLP
ncbi:MAG: DUF11 domain-containing protein, partial [Eggerthellaceae bacterium]|nr:DUF11 domain-containing protein [Eggerthellaceae bacterium]